MDFETSYIFCSRKLIDPLPEVQEIFVAIRAVPWQAGKVSATSPTGRQVKWQEAYNRLLELAFEDIGGWTRSPVLCSETGHKGDFLKNDVFLEVQFGNSATVYRDYYKFHYGLVNRLLSLAVHILPTKPVTFFPARNPASIRNMASYEYALRHFTSLTIPVPVLLIGLLPSNSS